VSDILEHSQISLEVAAFNSALAGDSPDYAAAKAVYQNGNGDSCKSSTQTRALQGFATKDLTGESFADRFYSSGNAVNFWDTWMLALLDDSAPLSGLSRVKRVTSLKKGVMGLVTLYASHELEAAIVKGATSTTRSDAVSAHAWDEGWAFYYGVDGTNMPYEVAGKRDANFPTGTQVQTAIAPYFNRGVIALRPGSYIPDAAVAARDTIYKMFAITYLRAAYKYLEISERAYSEKAHAEGYAYFKAIDGWVHSYDATAATTMRNALEITQTSIPAGTYCTAKAAMEAAYPAMGIDCTMMGEWTDSSVTVTSCSTPCSAATVSLSSGAGPVKAGSGTGVAKSCSGSTTGTAGTSSEDEVDSSRVLHLNLAVFMVCFTFFCGRL